MNASSCKKKIISNGDNSVLQINEKNAKLFVMALIKIKFLIKSCTRSLACVISSCFAKKMLPKYGFFPFKMSV